MRGWEACCFFTIRSYNRTTRLNRSGEGRILFAAMRTKAGKLTANRMSFKRFDAVRAVGLRLPDVEAATRYDGSPVLKVGGCFMAGIAMHPSAEPATMVVRVEIEERQWLLEDAPATYYVTDYYEKYPVVLVRLSNIAADALHDVLQMSRRLTIAKAGRRGSSRAPRRLRDRSATVRR